MPSIPFSEPSDAVEFDHTFAGRKPCPSCGEWCYPRRPVDSDGPFSFAPECEICGETLPRDE